jgi:D-sedoheptulose 7-phosphate isomerase
MPEARPPAFLSQAIRELETLLASIKLRAGTLDELAKWTADLILGGARLLVCGNGGSAAEAQHFATELVGRYSQERQPLPAIALVADGSLLTCIANDYSADEIFARQVRGLGSRGDLLVGLTTSGRSRNVIAAITAARELGLHTLALLGKDGGPLAGQADREWIVPSQSTARIQEAHLLFIHAVCDYVDARIGTKGSGVRGQESRVRSQESGVSIEGP